MIFTFDIAVKSSTFFGASGWKENLPGFHQEFFCQTPSPLNTSIHIVLPAMLCQKEEDEEDDNTTTEIDTQKTSILPDINTKTRRELHAEKQRMKKWTDASKARYVRTVKPRDFEIELSLKEVFPDGDADDEMAINNL